MDVQGTWCSPTCVSPWHLSESICRVILEEVMSSLCFSWEHDMQLFVVHFHILFFEETEHNPVNRILVPLQEVSDHAQGNRAGGLRRIAVDSSGYAGKSNRPQIVLLHHLQAVQIGIFQHLWMFSYGPNSGNDISCRQSVATADFSLPIFTSFESGVLRSQKRTSCSMNSSIHATTAHNACRITHD